MTDLNLVGNQYNIASVVFFVSYVAFEIPSNFVLKRWRPTIWIPCIMIAWSIVMIFMGFVKDFTGLTIARFFLGMAESGLFPGLSYFLTFYYRRDELAVRIAIFFAGATLSGAFGGLLAYGISRMDGIGGKPGWAWIFIIEGLLTLVVALASPWFLADFPQDAKFLTPEERKQVVARVNQEQGASSVDTAFEWYYVKDAMKDYRTYLLGLVYLSIAECFFAVSLFTPTIIAELGKWTRAESNLLSTPPFFLAFFVTIGSAYYSDKVRARGIFNVFWMLVTAVGYIILIANDPVTKPGVSYFALFLAVTGASPCIANTITWSGGTFGPAYKRAAALGFVMSCGNSAGIISSLTYIATDKPHFYRGHGVALAFALLAAGVSAYLVWDFKRENARRDALYGTASSSITPESVGPEAYAEQMRVWGLEGKTPAEVARLGDKHPGFRYIA